MADLIDNSHSLNTVFKKSQRNSLIAISQPKSFNLLSFNFPFVIFFFNLFLDFKTIFSLLKKSDIGASPMRKKRTPTLFKMSNLRETPQRNRFNDFKIVEKILFLLCETSLVNISV